MLTLEGCRNRQMRMWAALPEHVEWVLVADPRHVNYLCGFWVNPVSLSAGERGFLYLERDGETVLMTDSFTPGSAAQHPFVDRLITEPWYDRLHAAPNRDHVLFDALRHISARLHPRAGLMEAEWVPAGAFPSLGVGFERVPADGMSLGSLLRSLRRRKEPDEIELLLRCIRAGEAGHRRGREVVAPGVSELEIYREVQSAAIETLGEVGIVYGDFRATTPSMPKAGGPPTDYVLKRGDTFILDYSVVLSGYRGDFTNTLVAGHPTPEQQLIMDACRAGIESGERALCAGAVASEVYQSVNAPLAAAGWPLRSHAGHGLGLGHPEAPAFVSESDEVLERNDVVTLEPAAYVDGVGGVRIEHNYLVTESGFERLTHHAIGF